LYFGSRSGRRRNHDHDSDRDDDDENSNPSPLTEQITETAGDLTHVAENEIEINEGYATNVLTNGHYSSTESEPSQSFQETMRNIDFYTKHQQKSNILLLPRSKITATGSRRILQERSGNVAGSCRKAPEIAGSGSSISTGNLLDFFRWIRVNFLCFPTGTGRKLSEKIRKISGGNTASTFQRFSVLSCRNQPVIFDLGRCK
jgi:hypothetical protein